jgi:hypothetical protein
MILRKLLYTIFCNGYVNITCNTNFDPKPIYVATLFYHPTKYQKLRLFFFHILNHLFCETPTIYIDKIFINNIPPLPFIDKLNSIVIAV